MLRNYIKIAFRNFLRQKSYSFINLASLSLGMACCTLILLLVQNELSYDRHYKKAKQIYRILVERGGSGTSISTPPPLAQALARDFPGIVRAVRFFRANNPVPLVSYEERRFYEEGFFFADDDVFEMFSLPLLHGETKTALREPFSVVLTTEIARKYFGDEDPLGKTLTFKNWLEFKVTGVIQDLPASTHLRFDFLASFPSLEEWLGEERMRSWSNRMCTVYVELPEDHPVDELERQLKGWTDRYLPAGGATFGRIRLQPLTSIHLDMGSNREQVYVFSFVAILILIIACFNYMNLATARSAQRFREVDVRKVVGASRGQLIKQFIGESIFLTGLALLLAVVLVELGLPAFNAFVAKDLSIHYADVRVWLGFGCALFLIGTLAGCYPAVFLSSSNAVGVFGSRTKTGQTGFLLRRFLVVAQFTISIALISAAAVTYYQFDYLRTKNLGFDEERVVIVPVRDEMLRQDHAALKREMLDHPHITKVAGASLLPGGPVGRMNFRAEEAPVDSGSVVIRTLWVGVDFIETLGIKMTAGRDFSRNYPTDKDQAFILNEKATQQLGWEEPATAIGVPFERIKGNKPEDRVVGRIIGVVKDFHFRSLHFDIEPLVIHLWPWLDYMLIRIQSDDLSATLAFLDEKWQKFDPNHPFEYSFMG